MTQRLTALFRELTAREGERGGLDGLGASRSSAARDSSDRHWRRTGRRPSEAPARAAPPPRPDWLARHDVEAIPVDAASAADLRRALTGATAVIDLLRLDRGRRTPGGRGAPGRRADGNGRPPRGPREQHRRLRREPRARRRRDTQPPSRTRALCASTGRRDDRAATADRDHRRQAGRFASARAAGTSSPSPTRSPWRRPAPRGAARTERHARLHSGEFHTVTARSRRSRRRRRSSTATRGHRRRRPENNFAYAQDSLIGHAAAGRLPRTPVLPRGPCRAPRRWRGHPPALA